MPSHPLSHRDNPSAVPAGQVFDAKPRGTNGTSGTVGTRGTIAPLLAGDDADAIEERAGLAADRIPPVYLDAWTRLNHQKPARVSDTAWRLALDDGGRFLDAWGKQAVEAEWAPGEFFDVPTGLVWRQLSLS